MRKWQISHDIIGMGLDNTVITTHIIIIDSSNHPRGYRPVVTTRQEEVEDIDENDESQAIYGRVLENVIVIISCTIIDFPNHPRGYRSSPHVPVLRVDDDHCLHCLCALCIIDVPPDFLRGWCGPHPTNDEKRHRLYRLFWSTLKDFGVWRDDEYLQRKQEWTTIGDRHDIMPDCVVVVSYSHGLIHNTIVCRKYRQDIPALMANIGTINLSTIDAQ